MTRSKPYALTRPCEHCPFRTDIPPFLASAARVREIERSVVRSEFPCHKTLDYSETPKGRETDKTAHCAGALILLEKLGRPSQMMRIAERLGLYDRGKLDLGAPVFASFDAMAKAMGRRKRAR